MHYLGMGAFYISTNKKKKYAFLDVIPSPDCHTSENTYKKLLQCLDNY